MFLWRNKNNICPDTVLTTDFLSYFSMKTYVVGAHLKHLDEVLLTTTTTYAQWGASNEHHNMFFVEKPMFLSEYSSYLELR